MCEPMSAGYGIAALVGGIFAAKALTPKIPDAVAIPAAATPSRPAVAPLPLPTTQTPAQPSKTPAIQPMRAANSAVSSAAGRNASSSSTMLTGPAGVDMSMATVGKNTLLGQ